ncbi:jg3097 [Pararge aegeria aegeria]|uniref:Jg3097 protein n=1 Tax=Pararge aegeria aegeria TaxID=348720 RepID=A0A8S4QGG2_9NEOP|nr:jg3097 [Pararge aegeria aegeria]
MNKPPPDYNKYIHKVRVLRAGRGGLVRRGGQSVFPSVSVVVCRYRSIHTYPGGHFYYLLCRWFFNGTFVSGAKSRYKPSWGNEIGQTVAPMVRVSGGSLVGRRSRMRWEATSGKVHN